MITQAVILARGGSKGIPNKNIVKLAGQPLISYTIRTAQKILEKNVWVSTDCPKIADISYSYGAKILLRPKQLANDNSKSEDALLHFADNVDFSRLVFIQPTSPLLINNDIINGLNMMDTGIFDSVFSAYKEHWIPRWTLDFQPDNWNINKRPMRQDISEKYVENGALYITTRQSLLQSKCRYSGKIGIVEMPFSRSLQIDTYDDLHLMQQILKYE